LYPRVIFFSLAVEGLVELPGHVEAVDHRTGVGQQGAAGVVQRLPHVRPVSPDLLPLLWGELAQALTARGFVPPRGHRQHLRMLRVGQVGQDRDVQLVPLLQTQFVNAQVGDDTPRVDLLGLAVGQLVADDPLHGFGGDAQTPGRLRCVAADQQPQDLLLEAVGVADIAALERRDQVLTVAAVRAAVVGGLVDPEAGLPPEVQIADDLDGIFEFDLGLLLSAAVVAAAALGPGPGDFKAVAVAVAMRSGDGE
jgi:hypothetical protein